MPNETDSVGLMPGLRLKCVIVVLALSICGVWSLTLGADQPKFRAYEGVYRNDTYRYSVTLPRGVVGRGSAPPNPNHGFSIELSVGNKAAGVYGGTDSLVWVDGSYVPEDGVETLTDAVHFASRIMERSLDAKLQTESQTETSLGGLKAIRVTWHYDLRKVQMIQQEIIALNGGYMYTLGLRTTPARGSGDTRLFDAIASGFSILPARQ